MINTVKNEVFSDSCDKSSVSGGKSSRLCMLESLNMSDCATIVGLNATNELQNRLMGMGLTIGAKIEILHGGHGRFKPFIIGVGESRIAIGHDIAKLVLVESDAKGPS